MAFSVQMPALGESVTEGTVTRWLKQVGDTIEADEPLVEVSTDKVDTEIPSPVGGVILEIKAAEDQVVPVGAELAVIGASRAPGAAPAPPPPPAPPPTRPAPPGPTGTAEATAADGPVAAHSPGHGRRRYWVGSQARRRRVRRRRWVRDAAGTQARGQARGEPGQPHRHRGGRPHPQAGRARR